MVIITESRIFAFALSLSQEHQGKYNLLTIIIRKLGIFCCLHLKAMSLTPPPFSSIKGAEL